MCSDISVVKHVNAANLNHVRTQTAVRQLGERVQNIIHYRSGNSRVTRLLYSVLPGKQQERFKTLTDTLIAQQTTCVCYNDGVCGQEPMLWRVANLSIGLSQTKCNCARQLFHEQPATHDRLLTTGLLVCITHDRSWVTSLGRKDSTIRNPGLGS